MHERLCLPRSLNRSEESQSRAALRSLVDELIDELTRLSTDITEGTVMTQGPAPYRRLDCDRRALAYVRARPRKQLVRIDISGLWALPRESPLATQGSGGSTTLVVRSREDKNEAVAFLLATVESTRVQRARAEAREAELNAREQELRDLLPRHQASSSGSTGEGALLAADAPLSPDEPPR